jgi:hypothetical protein
MDVYDKLLKEFLACVEGHEMPKEALDHIKRVWSPIPSNTPFHLVA